ncbi:MAG: hypothetical protein ABID61_01125 [Candidatus Micrarchaeota archaeon]
MNKIWIFILVLLSITSSAFVATRIYDQDDLGDIAFKEFTYSIAVDCNNSLLKIIVMNGSNMPVANATTYLQYLENTNPIISRITTSANGTTIHKLPGNTNYMRSRWNLLIEKTGFRNKAVQFDLAPCYSNWTPPIYVPPAAKNITNATQQPPKTNQTNQNSSNKSVSGNEQPAFEDNELIQWFPAVLLIAVLFILFKSVKLNKKHASKCDNNSSNPSSRMYWRKQKQPRDHN